MSTYEFLLSLIGLAVVGVLGTVLARRNARSVRERRFVLKAVGLQAILALGILCGYYFFQWKNRELVLALVLILIVPTMYWIQSKVQHLRRGDNTHD